MRTLKRHLAITSDHGRFARRYRLWAIIRRVNRDDLHGLRSEAAALRWLHNDVKHLRGLLETDYGRAAAWTHFNGLSLRDLIEARAKALDRVKRAKEREAHIARYTEIRLSANERIHKRVAAAFDRRPRGQRDQTRRGLSMLPRSQ